MKAKGGKRRSGAGRTPLARAAAARRRRRVATPGAAASTPAFRIGHGYDAHRLEPGDGVVLGGVRIACPHRVVAHSDGDALIHALCDALLGALALGDIGKLFPDTDERFRGADSRGLLREVMRRVREARYAVANVDATVIAEAPRLAPHVDAMRTILAAELQVAADAVGIKATTPEGMDAIGRREGLAAHCVVLLQKT